jgi:hypothetical protein
MGLEPTLDQTSNAVDTCFDDDDVAHTSPFKRYCDHTCTEALHTGKRCRACQYVINARAAPCFLGISICLKMLQVKIRRNSPCLLSLGLRHQRVLPLLTKLVEFRTEMNNFDRVFRAVLCSLTFRYLLCLCASCYSVHLGRALRAPQKPLLPATGRLESSVAPSVGI